MTPMTRALGFDLVGCDGQAGDVLVTVTEDTIDFIDVVQGCGVQFGTGFHGGQDVEQSRGFAAKGSGIGSVSCSSTSIGGSGVSRHSDTFGFGTSSHSFSPLEFMTVLVIGRILCAQHSTIDRNRQIPNQK